MDRKTFIKNGSLIGLGLTVGAPTIWDNKKQRIKANPSTKKKVIVAGAGIAGLACAYELMKLGHEVVLLEASGRYGGTVMTVRDGLADDLYADYGAENFTKPGYENYWKYIDEFEIPVLKYHHRENRVTFRDGIWISNEESLKEQFSRIKNLGGLNQREEQVVADNENLGVLKSLEKLYLQPYLENFSNEYQPFGVGYDYLDAIPISDIYRKEKASDAAMQILGGRGTSALFKIWQMYIMQERRYWDDFDLYRIKGGNDILPKEFSKRLGHRIQLGCKIIEINHDNSGVKIVYEEFGQTKTIDADFLASCLPVNAFQNIIITPQLPSHKQIIFNNIVYQQKSRVVFQARSKFWEKDNTSINLTFNHSAIETIWQVAEEVDSSRTVLMAKSPSGINPLRTLNTFKELYPGDARNIDIEQILIKDWSEDQFTPGCERNSAFPMGHLSNYWPYLIEPVGRIYFAGGYADNRSWGMEAATNSANRIAMAIDQS